MRKGAHALRRERVCVPERYRAPQVGDTPLHVAVANGHAAVVSCRLWLRSCVAIVGVWYREGHGCEKGRTHLRGEGGCVTENAARRSVETPRFMPLFAAATRRAWRCF